MTTTTHYTRDEAFQIAFDKMNQTFSSHEFGKAVRDIGFVLIPNSGGIIRNWLLKKKKMRRISKKVWYKTDVRDKILSDNSVKTISEFLHGLPTDKLIEHLQSLGYIILKP